LQKVSGKVEEALKNVSGNTFSAGLDAGTIWKTLFGMVQRLKFILNFMTDHHQNRRPSINFHQSASKIKLFANGVLFNLRAEERRPKSLPNL